MQEIHITERSSFEQCTLKWYFRNVLHLEPKLRQYNNFWFGTGLHYALAQYYKDIQRMQQTGDTGFCPPAHYWEKWFGDQMATDSIARLPEETQQQIVEWNDLATGMLSHYISQFDPDKEWTILSVEETYRVELPEYGVVLVATPDLVVEENGSIFAVDHKGYASFVDPEDLRDDDQMSGYCWILTETIGKERGKRVSSALYNQLLKSVPCEPQVVYAGKKNEGLSKAKNIRTTVEIYRAALVERGYPLEDYADVLKHIEENVRFFQRSPVARTPMELKIWEERILRRQIPRICATGWEQVVPAVSRDCRKSCSYCDLCRCYRTGGNLDGMIDLKYDVSDKQVYGTDMEGV